MSLRTLGGSLVVVLLAAGPSAAQSVGAYFVPTPYPTASAAGRDWYEQALPILYTGDLYYPAGPQVHFDPDLMIPAGDYDGVPLYVDPSISAYSQVLVPVGDGLLQPYERRRVGVLAGTTGSHAPSFPVEAVPGVDMSESQPPPAWQREGAWRQPAPAGPYRGRRSYPGEEEARMKLLEQPGHIATIRTPDDNLGIWIDYEGRRWTASSSTPFDASRYSKIGEYHGFPVYAASGSEEIYIPAVPGMLSVYKKDAKTAEPRTEK